MPPKCRYFNSGKGCREGTECRFLHVPKTTGAPLESGMANASQQGASKETKRTSVVTLSEDRAPVTRPQRAKKEAVVEIPGRQLELQQLERRYRSSYQVICEDNQGVQVQLTVVPSDPDFPYELEGLMIRFLVPATYPKPPVLTAISIVNADLPDAIREQVVQRIARYLTGAHAVTLVERINWIDRNLERLFLPSDTLSGVIDSWQGDGVTIKLVRPVRGSNGATAAAVVPTVMKQGSESSKNQDGSIFTTDQDNSGRARTIDRIQDLTLGEMHTRPDPSASRPVELIQTILRGTRIQLVGLQMQSISLLQCSHLSVLVQCGRCKKLTEILGLVPQKPRNWSCLTCHSGSSVCYRSQALHTASDSVGFLDLENCLLADYLPSQFEPTCAECPVEEDSQESTKEERQFSFKKVSRGVWNALSCRFCHAAMRFQFEEVRFQRAGALENSSGGEQSANKKESTPKKSSRRDVKDPKIIPGEPLPKSGTCKHYSKSYRWFRFPCCGRAYPCDLCHQSSNDDDHEMVLGNRMICGFCSHEQKMSDKAECSRCGKDTAATAGTHGFWEGGKGVRDRNRMSRKDTHKFQGLGKTTSRKQQNAS